MFSKFTTFFRGYDWFLAVVIFVLCAISLSAIYSVDLSQGKDLVYFPKQLLNIIIGFILVFVLGRVHRTRYMGLARFVYIFGLLLLILVLFFGQNIRGTTGWFRVAGFSFQPAEYAKFALIILLGWWIQKQGRSFHSISFLISTALAMGFLVGLVMLQPDFGSAMVLVGIWYGMLVVVGVKKRFTAGIVLIGIFAMVCAWFFLLVPYQKERIYSFLQPDRDPLGSGYNVRQSLIAIGSGKLFGGGIGFGSQSQLHFLPEAQTDFIMSVVGEELGFVGFFLVLVLWYMLIWRLISIASKGDDDFSSYTVIGVALLYCIQILVNVGGATGMLPVTGVTSPFLSYGGSSLLINFALLGVVMSISRSQTLRINKDMYYVE